MGTGTLPPAAPPPYSDAFPSLTTTTASSSPPAAAANTPTTTTDGGSSSSSFAAPLLPESATTTTAGPRSPAPSSTTTAGRKKQAVLWVDDQPSNNAHLVRRVQSESDVEVILATSTRQAMSIVAQLRPRLVAEYDLRIITDMHRIEEGGAEAPLAGIDLVRELHSLRLRLKVLLFTSFTKNLDAWRTAFSEVDLSATVDERLALQFALFKTA
ncbi:hypothetical protein DFJ73DRAFT_859248 [Zopfochytrium polystomum]|nr:hypothetical protein DFJ73DRAFT_859248 [Zopfochytrium polystomum]